MFALSAENVGLRLEQVIHAHPHLPRDTEELTVQLVAALRIAYNNASDDCSWPEEPVARWGHGFPAFCTGSSLGSFPWGRRFFG